MSNKIGFWSVFAIVTGSQIGSGVFMLPSSLAPYGIWGLFGYLISGCGALALSFVFASLCAKWPRTGGPHVYAQHSFGPMIGFFCGWTYWVISWVSTTAVIITSVGCLSPFFTNDFIVNHSREFYLLLEIILLFIITFINLKGIIIAGRAEFILTVLKFIPLIILPITALYYFDKQNFIISATVNVTGSFANNFSILGKVTLLTLWGFIGLETATTPADAVLNPAVTIPRAIILGTLSVLLLYILNFIGINGSLSGFVLMNSVAPYMDVAQNVFGGNWHLLIAIITSIICIGTLNAWVLTSGQIALGLAKDGLFPKFFAKKNRFDAPVVALLVSSTLIVPLLFLVSTKSFTQQILVIVDISVIAFLFVYLICCLSFLKLLLQKKQKAISSFLFGLLALMFCCWIIYATPVKTLLLASLFTLSGVPVYLFCRVKKAD